jgi:branched-chain amino acid transport system substrate-binding protein
MDENAMKAAGKAADGVVFPVRTGAILGRRSAGHDRPSGKSRRSPTPRLDVSPVHYISGICSAFT